MALGICVESGPDVPVRRGRGSQIDMDEDYGRIGCWVFGWVILDMIVGGMLGASLEGTGLVVGFGVYIALSLVFWAAF
jgi:hypothetical protein